MEATLPRGTGQPHGEPPTHAPVDAAGAVDGTAAPDTVARDTSDRAADIVTPSSQAMPSATPLREAHGRFMLGAGQHLAALGIALVAILISLVTWQH